MCAHTHMRAHVRTRAHAHTLSVSFLLLTPGQSFSSLARDPESGGRSLRHSVGPQRPQRGLCGREAGAPVALGTAGSGWLRGSCPAAGAVYDDVAGGGCVPVSQCGCKLHGHLYTPGQEITNNCEQWWVPGRGSRRAVDPCGLGVQVGWGVRPGGLGVAVEPDTGPSASQCLQRWPLGVPGPAVPRDLHSGGWCAHLHLRREEVHLPWGLLLRADQGRLALRACGRCPSPCGLEGDPAPPAV